MEAGRKRQLEGKGRGGRGRVEEGGEAQEARLGLSNFRGAEGRRNRKWGQSINVKAHQHGERVLVGDWGTQSPARDTEED